MRNIFRIIRAKRRYSPFIPIIIIHQFSPKKSKILSIYQINLFLIKKRACGTFKKSGYCFFVNMVILNYPCFLV